MGRSFRSESIALSKSRRTVILNLLPGILDIFTGAVDRMASHRSQERNGGKQQ
jgi:hypothetical protein